MKKRIAWGFVIVLSTFAVWYALGAPQISAPDLGGVAAQSEGHDCPVERGGLTIVFAHGDQDPRTGLFCLGDNQWSVDDPDGDSEAADTDTEGCTAERNGVVISFEVDDTDNVTGATCQDDGNWRIEIDDDSRDSDQVGDDSSSTAGEWEIVEIDLDGNPIVAAWLDGLLAPAPALWQTAPNIPNPLVEEFRVVSCQELDASAPADTECVPDGMEWGPEDSPFCERDQTCDIIVSAGHYRLITGDYEFLDWSCSMGTSRQGCLLLLINVGEETHTFRDQMVDNGFTVFGRYFNGDDLEWGTWGMVSHVSANMLNMRTYSAPGVILNSGEGVNAGSNCGNTDGCESVHARIVVHAGNRLIANATTVVERE